MSWKKKNPSVFDIKSAVLSNSGLSEKDFFELKEDYYIENLEKAAELLKQMVQNKKKIFIIGDYDVDGITSTSILYLMLKEMGCKNLSIYIPKRFSDGYGVPQKIIDTIDCDLLITVDNGITAVEQIAKIKEKGIKVIVLDHHLMDGDKGLPPADVIVDPKVIHGSDFDGYCGAGIAFKLAQKINQFTESFMDKLCALAAIGTVADVMPIIHDNRKIVINGLKALNNKNATTGINELIKRLGISFVQSADIGFKIAPILNAAGRMKDNGGMLSFNVLTYNSPWNIKLSKDITELESLNSIRKTATADGIDIAHRKIAEDCLFGDKLLLLYTTLKEKSVFHEGVVGIVAGRLAEEFKLPVFVLCESKVSGVLKGSGRSYGSVNIKALLDKVPPGILNGYGGHEGAAGISVSIDKVEELRSILLNLMEDVEIKEDCNEDFYDLEISQQDIPNVLAELKKYAPYGAGNPSPIFKINNYRLFPKGGNFFAAMGEKGSTIKLYGGETTAIGFGMTNKFKNAGEPSLLVLYGSITENYYLSASYIQVEINDFEQDFDKKPTSVLANLVSEKMKKMFS